MTRLLAGTALVAWYVAAFVRSTLEVAVAGLRRDPGLVPTVLVVPVRLRGWRLALFANMVTLTPGTLSIDIPADESTLVVHTLWGDRADDVRAEVDVLQDRLGRVLL